MKIKTVKIVNVGLLRDETIEFNKPLLLFYGDICQGKSTVLNAIRWLLGAEVPSDLITHGEKECVITLELDCGVISRSWYVGKDGKTRWRNLVFVRDGRPVEKPAGEVARLLNPFTLDQNFLVKMGETARKRYFAELFAVDTTALDTEAVNLEREASALRSQIDGYGEIDLTPVPESNITALRQKLQAIRQEHKNEVSKVAAANRGANTNNDDRKEHADAVVDWQKEIERLQARIAESTKWLQEHPVLALRPDPPEPDTSALEQQIEQEAANEVRREQLKANQKRADEKVEKAKALSAREGRLRAVRKEKVSKLAEASTSSKVKGLVFNEGGDFTYNGTTAGMLSTSQLMQLSSELSAMYPKGLGIELIDRGESLGKSIFEFVEKARREESTILATIVGEAPAKTPAGVGVFVVEKGKVKAQPELV